MKLLCSKSKSYFWGPSSTFTEHRNKPCCYRWTAFVNENMWRSSQKFDRGLSESWTSFKAFPNSNNLFFWVFIQFANVLAMQPTGFFKSDPVKLVHSRFFKQSPRPSLTLFSQMENETPQFAFVNENMWRSSQKFDRGLSESWS
jgi:hypothetical protein